MELANFRVQKCVDISQEKMDSRVVKPRIKKSKIIGNRHANCVLRKRVSSALRPPLPSSDLANFLVPDEPSSEEEGSGEEGGEEESEEGGEDGGEEGSEDSEEDVLLAQRKVARV
jgi:hypothetical protein